MGNFKMRNFAYLTFFFFFWILNSLEAKAQTFAPNISNPVIESTTNCSGSELEFSFQVTNGYTRTWFLIYFYSNFINFTTETNYTVYLKVDGQSDRALESFTSSAPSGNSRDAFKIQKTISLPQELTGNGSFNIYIRSDDPEVESDSSLPFKINPPPSVKASFILPSCIGEPIQLTSNYIPDASYRWTGPNGAFIGNEQNLSIPDIHPGAVGDYKVNAFLNGCSSSSTVYVDPYPSQPGNENSWGNNAWIGHIYDGNNFGKYLGNYTETETFDQKFGNEECFPLETGHSFKTESFSVRYKMKSSRSGLYTVDLGSDDGSRLHIDGTSVYDNWSPQSYSPKPNVLLSLSGKSELEYEYYEDYTDNRVTFHNLKLIIANRLLENQNQILCSGQAASAIIGDSFNPRPTGLTSPEYSWSYSSTPEGPRTPLARATSKDFQPNLNSAPFNTPGTYYIYRTASLVTSNNTGLSSRKISHTSSPAVITINPPISNNSIGYGITGSRSGTANENGTLNITAPAGTLFNSVDFASYGTPEGSDGNYAISNCHSSTSKAVVEGYLLGKNSAAIPATNAVFGDPCVGTGKRLYVKATYSTPIVAICAGSSTGPLTGSIPVGSNNFKYLWESSTTGPSSGFAPSRGTNKNKDYSPGALDQTTWFQRKIIVNGCVGSISNVIEIPVNQPITNNNINGAQEICGPSVGLELSGSSVSGGNGTYSYIWENSTTGPDSGFEPAPGNRSSSSYNLRNITGPTWFRRIVRSGGCAESTSKAVKVIPEVGNNSIVASKLETCINSGPLILTGTAPVGGDGSFSYSWESSTTGGEGSFTPIAGNNTRNYSPSSLSQTTWFRRIVSSAGCPSSVSDAISIVINPLPTVELTGDSSICVGQTAKLTGTFTGKGPWTITTNIPGLPEALSVPANQSTYTISVTPTASTTYKVISITDANGCTNNETFSFTVSVIEESIWTGATSNNWNTASNWSCDFVPTINTKVIIPPGLGRYPILENGNRGYSKNITIETGASLEVRNNTLEIAGAIDNKGIFWAGTGSIALVGSLAQTIPTGVFEQNRIKNLIINNSNGVKLKGNLEISGLVRVDSGILDVDLDQHLKLLSDENQTALIDGSGNGDIRGKVTMQRYLNKAFGYKYFSSPFKNSFVGSFSAFINLDETFPNFYRYDENRKEAISKKDATGWVPYTQYTNPLEVLRGYALNFGDDNAPVTVEIEGTVNNGDLEIALQNNQGEYTQGFNLVGNPYPSPIDWNAAGWNKRNIDNSVYFFTAGDTDRYTGTYSSYVDGISSDGKSSNIIPSMQGFFVHVSDPSAATAIATGTLGLKNSVRVNDFDQEFLKSYVHPQFPLIRLTAGLEENAVQDPLVIYFKHKAKTSFDKDLDALKMMNTDVRVPSFYSLTPERKQLSISAIPQPTYSDHSRIPLGLQVQTGGSMLIKLKDLENISSSSYIYLLDMEKKILQDLVRNPEYRFHAKAGTTDSRFFLLFSETKLTDPAVIFEEPFSVVTEGNKVKVQMNLNPGVQGSLRISTLTGQILEMVPVTGKQAVELKGIKSEGVYLVSLIGHSNTPFTKKILTKK